MSFKDAFKNAKGKKGKPAKGGKPEEKENPFDALKKKKK